MAKLPWFQFYPSDWLNDPGVRSLTHHDKGIWIDIICLMHQMENRGYLAINGKKIDENTFSRLVGLDKQILSRSLSKMKELGIFSETEDGTIYCRRMVKDEYIRQVRIKAGKKGGNPNLKKSAVLLNQTSKQNPTLVSSHKSLVTSQKKKNTKNKEIIYSESFLRFWKVYPRKVSKDAAFREWEKMDFNGELTIEDVIKSVEDHCRNAWSMEDMTHIVHASTFLHQRLYTDELKEKPSWVL